MSEKVEVISTVSVSYSLYLNHNDWKLGFQVSPEYRVVAQGRKPTRDEVIEALLPCGLLPIMMIDIVWSIVNTLEWKNEN